MTDEPTPRTKSPGDSPRERRRRIAAVFGDVLPETSSDERDDDLTAAADDHAQDRWLRNQVPPHHD